MIWNPFKITSKGFLGVDIGTFSIKIVEISRAGKRNKLENYGEIRAAALYEKPFRTFEKSTLSFSNAEVTKAVGAILKESGMKARKAYFSIPDFSTFFTTIKLPAMTEAELPQAINYEAKQHIPLPLQGVTLDWQIIERGEKKAQGKLSPYKILLVAVPNNVIQQYQQIAQSTGLELLTLEAEVFSLVRSLVKEEGKTESLALVDIGARSTTISIVDKGVLKISHSFDTSGNDFTNIIAKGMSIDYKEAEDLKKKHGLLPSESKTKEAILPLVDLVLNEIRKIFSSFEQAEKEKVKKIFLAGGSALLPGIVDYFAKSLGKPVEIANPFSNIYYPPILEDTLKTMGPSYAIAVGTALHGLE